MPDQFKLTKAALADLSSIGRYTQEKYGVGRRKKYVGELNKRFVQLSKSSHLGRERPEIDVGVRSVVEGKHIIFYRVKDTNIEILRVLHGNMDLKRQID